MAEAIPVGMRAECRAWGDGLWVAPECCRDEFVRIVMDLRKPTVRAPSPLEQAGMDRWFNLIGGGVGSLAQGAGWGLAGMKKTPAQATPALRGDEADTAAYERWLSTQS